MPSNKNKMINFEKIQQNNEGLREEARKRVMERIEKEGVDEDRIVVIAKKLNQEIPRGDELREETFSAYIEELVDEELGKSGKI